MNENEAQYINKLEKENAMLKQQLENIRLPEVGDCYKLPGSPYTYKLCKVELEGYKFFVLFNLANSTFYSEPKNSISAAFGVNTNNYKNRIRVDDPRS